MCHLNQGVQCTVKSTPGANVSNTDSFIDEVTEEVQRDKLYAALRKYGWIGVVAVVAIVGGAAYNEWSKSKAETLARANGDAITTALMAGGDDAGARADALAAAGVTGSARIVADMVRAGELAILKTAMIGAGDIAPEDRIAQLAGIASPGAPYRLLAEEQIATAQVELGDVEAAVAGLRAIAQDVEATEALRRRSLQMIVALGADPVAQ